MSQRRSELDRRPELAWLPWFGIASTGAPLVLVVGYLIAQQPPFLSELRVDTGFAADPYEASMGDLPQFDEVIPDLTEVLTSPDRDFLDLPFDHNTFDPMQCGLYFDAASPLLWFVQCPQPYELPVPIGKSVPIVFVPVNGLGQPALIDTGIEYEDGY